MGRAATSTRTGEFLRLGYERVADGEWVTRVWNESPPKSVPHTVSGGYDERGTVGYLIEPTTGLTTTYTYDAAGRLSTQSRTAGTDMRTTTFIRDGSGRIVETRESATGTGDSIVTQSTYFAGTAQLPNPTSAAFCLTQSGGDVGAQQTLCLDALGQLGKVVESATGVLAGQSLYLASREQSVFDRVGNRSMMALKDASGTITHRQRSVTYDTDRHPIREWKYTTDPQSAAYVKESYFDALGRTLAVTDERFANPAATHDGNRTAANRELGYDRLGRLTSVTVGKGTPEQATTTYAYDAHDNLTRVTDADGRVTDYLYDDFGALILVRSPDSGDTRYRYDATGSLVEKLEADGKRTQYDYDARRRLIAERFDVATGPHAQDRHFYYDSLAGSGATVGAQCPTNDNLFDVNIATLNTRLAWVTHGAGRAYYSYDGFGATVAVYEQQGATFDVCALAITRYGYDPLGRHTSTTYPTGRRVEYLYAAGAPRPTSVQLIEPSQPSTPIVLASNITYDAQGEVTGYAAGVIDFAASFDLAGQATERTYAGASGHAFDWQVASRDGSGNILGLMDAATGKALTATYDGQDRLASAVGEKLRGYQDCAWEYDGAGNRISEACYDKSIEYTYEPGTNRLAALAWENDARACGEGLQVEERDIGRDAVGRATSGWKERFAKTIDGYALAYGVDGRLATATVGLDEYAYAYDHRNLRLAKSGPATNQRAVFDTGGSILAELEATNTGEYVWLGGRAIAYFVDADGTATTPASVHVLATDHLATPMRAYDPTTGMTTWAADYEAFGDATQYMPGSTAPASIDLTLRFPGQQYDEETGLHYNWWREYEPGVGRYLQGDPMGQFDGVAPFIYAASNPVRHFDPAGLCVGRVDLRPCPPIVTPLPPTEYLQTITVSLSVCASGIGTAEGLQQRQLVKTAVGSEIRVSYEPTGDCDECPDGFVIPCFYLDSRIDDLDVTISRITCPPTPFPQGKAL